MTQPSLTEPKQLAKDHKKPHASSLCMAKFTPVEKHSTLPAPSAYQTLHQKSLLASRNVKMPLGTINFKQDKLEKGFELWSYNSKTRLFLLPFSDLKMDQRISKHHGHSYTPCPCSVLGSKGKACFSEHIHVLGVSTEECLAPPCVHT